MAAEPATPRPAATVILLRRGGRHSTRGLEVLMLQRGAQARFMPGIWVFAGGAVEDVDREGRFPAPNGVGADEMAHRVCGTRELGEEASVEVEPAALLPWSRWITPEEVPMRFDTRFYVGLAPPHCQPEADLVEMDSVRWITPATALSEHAENRFELSFPTIKHLEELSSYPDADAVLANAANRPVVPLTPKVIGTRESFEILLPGDPRYEDA